MCTDSSFPIRKNDFSNASSFHALSGGIQTFYIKLYLLMKQGFTLVTKVMTKIAERVIN
jgi:hypothetical protein